MKNNEQESHHHLEGKAWNLSLKYLSRAQKSRQEILNYLAKKGYPKSINEKVVQRLEKALLIDDKKYAYAFVEEKTSNSNNPIGPAKLRYELYQKGIAREIIDETLSCLTEAQERELIERAIMRKHGCLDNIDLREKQKLAAYLQRKGFNLELIIIVLDLHDV